MIALKIEIAGDKFDVSFSEKQIIEGYNKKIGSLISLVDLATDELVSIDNELLKVKLNKIADKISNTSKLELLNEILALNNDSGNNKSDTNKLLMSMIDDL